MPFPRMHKTAAQATPSLAADAWAQTFFEAHEAPAMAFAVAGSDGLLWSAAQGFADLEFAVAARPEHLFRLGSVSKVVTATAASRLATRGILELDTPIAYWLPELPAHHRQTTLRQLFTHTGGIRHYGPKDLDPASPGGPVTQRYYPDRASILALFIEDELVAPPGTRVSYSSYGYSLAAMVMEAATGQAFLTLVAEEIALPFALPSLCADDPLRVVPGRVSGYFTARELALIGERMPGTAPATPTGEHSPMGFSNPAFCWAGAGFLMTMSDLARFGAALLDGPDSAITPEERVLLFTPLTQACDASPPLGLGWRIDSDGHGRLRWHHAGTTPGGRCGLAIYPELGLAIALGGNTMTVPGDVLGAASELADLFMENNPTGGYDTVRHAICLTRRGRAVESPQSGAIATLEITGGPMQTRVLIAYLLLVGLVVAGGFGVWWAIYHSERNVRRRERRARRARQQAAIAQQLPEDD